MPLTPIRSLRYLGWFAGLLLSLGPIFARGEDEVVVDEPLRVLRRLHGLLDIDESVPKAFIVDMEHPPENLVRWKASLGNSAGPIRVAAERVLVGTNVGPRFEAGAMRCFEAANGRLLWQTQHERLPLRANDLSMGITSQAAVDGHQVFYVSNRGELVCCDLQDVPRQVPQPGGDPNDSARVVWKLDMVKQLGVFKRDAGDVGNLTCSPLVLGKLVYCLTGNGSSFGYAKDYDRWIPAPDAPSFLAVDRDTGAVVWSSNAPGQGIMIGQWASPVSVEVNGTTQILFPGGDGVLYGFHPTTGKLEWSLDCNDAQSTAWAPAKRGTRLFFQCRPTVVDNVLYATLGHEIEGNSAIDNLVVAIDLKPIDQHRSPALLWSNEDYGSQQMFGEVQVSEDRVYGASLSGELVVLNARTGQEVSRQRLGESSAFYGSPLVLSNCLAFLTEGELQLLTKEDQPKCLKRLTFSNGLANAPVVVKDTLYVTTRSAALWALNLKTFLATGQPG